MGYSGKVILPFEVAAKTPAAATYHAAIAVRMPIQPPRVVRPDLAPEAGVLKSPSASRRNVRNSKTNTAMRPPLSRKDAIIMMPVKIAQPSKYRPSARCDGPVPAVTPKPGISSAAKESQKAPNEQNAVALKGLPLANSHIPASSWAIPP